MPRTVSETGPPSTYRVHDANHLPALLSAAVLLQTQHLPVAFQVALAPAKTRAQAANATAVYDISKDGVLAANNSAVYKSTDALPYHVANTPDVTRGSSGTGAAATSDSSATGAIAQGQPSATSAAGSSLGELIQVMHSCHRRFCLMTLSLATTRKPYGWIHNTCMADVQ